MSQPSRNTWDERNLFAHSLYIVTVVLSGVNLLTDLTLLSDIGKEYVRWEVGGQWLMLYGFTVFHLAVVVCGILCGLLGIVGLVLSLRGIVSDRFRGPWMLFLSSLALFPLAVFLFYMIVKNRRKPLSAWFDEKQMADTAMGALFTVFTVMPLLALVAIADTTVRIGLPASFWLMQAFFVGLTVFSSTTLARSNWASGISRSWRSI